MQQIVFNLHNQQPICVQGNYPQAESGIERLAALCGLPVTEAPENMFPGVVWKPLSDNNVPEENVVFRTKTIRMVYSPEEKRFHLYLKNDSQLQRRIYCIGLWQISILCAVISAILQGRNVQLVHCAMLEKDGQALLLLGESGIGKSTSSRRWRSAGNTAIADDMVMLEYTNEDILVHRLPTWSACRIELDGRLYAYDPPLKLKNVLAITRDDEQEHVGEISKAEFYAQLYRCGFFHYLNMAGKLPEAEKAVLKAKICQYTNTLTGRFPARALFAHLDGNIVETLGEIL